MLTKHKIASEIVMLKQNNCNLKEPYLLKKKQSKFIQILKLLKQK